jgi:hypothetical protein
MPNSQRPFILRIEQFLEFLPRPFDTDIPGAGYVCPSNTGSLSRARLRQSNV